MTNLFINEHKYPLLAEALKAEDGRAFYRELPPEERTKLDAELHAAIDALALQLQPVVKAMKELAKIVNEKVVPQLLKIAGENNKEEEHGEGTEC